MADRMMFPATIQEFIKEYSFKDKEEIYTNGSELIPVFRMEQAHAYYSKEIRNQAIDEFVLRIECESANDWLYDLEDDEEYDNFLHEIEAIAKQMKGE